MAILLLFVLPLYLLIAPMEGCQVATVAANSFGVHSTKPAGGFFLMQEACNSSKRPVLYSGEFGSDGEEMIIVRHFEYDANICRSAPRPGETIIDIDPPRFQTPPSSPSVGEGHNNSSLKVDGVYHGVGGFPGRGPGGGGGGGPDSGGGGGPDGGGGGGPGGNSDTDSLSNGRNRRRGDGQSLKKIHAALKKLAKMSIFIAAQTGTALLFVTGGSLKSIEYSIVAIVVTSYLVCLFSFVVRESKPLKGAIISGVGSLLAALGFLLTMCLIIPPEFIWVLLVAAILLFFSLSALSFY